MERNRNFVLCEGIGCILSSRCERFLCGERVDRHAEGYNWMAACDVDHRDGFIGVSNEGD